MEPRASAGDTSKPRTRSARKMGAASVRDGDEGQ